MSNGKRFDGKTSKDRKLWHTYVYWAREKASFGQTEDKATSPAIVDDKKNRVEDSFSFALQTIVFSAFALEYRVKRVLIEMEVEPRPRECFRTLLKHFWNRLSNIDRCNKKKKCRKPSEWDDCLEKLLELMDLRNEIAHADYCEIFSSFSGVETPLEMARKYYNSVIDAIRIINVGTGYWIGSNEEAKEYYKILKVADEW